MIVIVTRNPIKDKYTNLSHLILADKLELTDNYAKIVGEHNNDLVIDIENIRIIKVYKGDDIYHNNKVVDFWSK